MNNQQLEKEIKQLFYQSKFEDCVKRVNELCYQELDFTVYQTLQLYKGLSQFEQSQLKEGKQCIQQLLQESKEVKGEQVDEIDVIIQIFFLSQLFDREFYLEEYDIILFEIIQKFKQQNDSKPSYNNGIYLYGFSMYKFFENNDNIECVELLKQALEITPQYKLEIMNQIAWMYDYQQKSSLSLEYSKKLYEINPNFPGLTNNIGITYKSQSDYQNALKYMKIQMEVSPNNPQLLCNIGAVYQDLQDKEMAEEYFKKSCELNDQLGFCNYMYGLFLKENNRPSEALEILHQGIKHQPSFYQLYQEIYKIEVENLNFSKCQDLLDLCKVFMPQEGYLYYQMGFFLSQEEDISESIFFIKKALSFQLNEKQRFHANAILASNLYTLDFEKESLILFLQLLNTENQFSNETGNVLIILNNGELVSEDDKILLINEQYGPIQNRYENLLQNIQKPNIKIAILTRQSYYLQILSLIAYQNLIQPQLTHQNEISHWDMYID